MLLGKAMIESMACYRCGVWLLKRERGTKKSLGSRNRLFKEVS